MAPRQKPLAPTKLAGRISHALAKLVQFPASLLVHALPAHLPLASLMRRRAHHAAQVTAQPTHGVPPREVTPRAA